MNTPSGIDVESQSVGNGGCSHLVAIGLQWPSPGAVSSLPMTLLLNAAEAAMSRAQIQATGWGALPGPGFMVVTTNVADRNPALREFRRLAEELADLELWEIAFYDQAEGIWRTVFPVQAPPFERFLSKANFQSAAQQIQAEMALSKAISEVLKHQVSAQLPQREAST